jgi:hypothetical protein
VVLEEGADVNTWGIGSSSNEMKLLDRSGKWMDGKALTNEC